MQKISKKERCRLSIMVLWMGMLDLLLEILRSRHLESENQSFDIQHLMVVHRFHKH
jgi:hypothetical protein